MTERARPKIPGATMHGYIYPTDNVDELTKEMLDVVMPGDKYLYVGWYPPFDRGGSYVITEINGDLDPDTYKTTEIKSFEKVIAYVEKRANEMLAESFFKSNFILFYSENESPSQIVSEFVRSKAMTTSSTEPSPAPMYQAVG